MADTALYRKHLFEGLPDASSIVQAINDLRREQGMLPVDPNAAADQHFQA